MVINNAMHKRTSKQDNERNEWGRKNDIEGIVADNSSKVRGRRIDRLMFEESGSYPQLRTAWTKGDALVTVAGARKGIMSAWGCVCAGTKVWTASGKLINVENLTQQDGIIGFKDGHANEEQITYMQPPAVKPCVRVTSSMGVLECSEDHPILIRTRHSKRRKDNYNLRDRWYDYEFVQAKDIMKYKDRNVMMACDKIDIFGTETLDDPYLVGLLIGDGTYRYNSTPKLNNCDSEVWDYVESKYKCNYEKGHITKDGKDYKEMRILGICPMLRKIGIYGQTKTNKRLPTNYQSLCKEDSRLLISGLFDTDGCVCCGKISIVQSSEEILLQIQELLYKFGVHSTIRETKPRIRPGRKDKNPWYTLAIENDKSVYNFAKEIPLKISYKQQRLLEVIKQIESSSNWKHLSTIGSGMREVRIISVEFIGLKPIYNLTAGDSHTYLANNIITHNTGR